MDKKKIIAIILFILFGLFIFTFANPGPSELDPVEVPGQGEVDDDESDDVQDDEEENLEDEEENDGDVDRPVVEVDNAPIIEVNPTTVTILFGQNYNVMTGISATDDNDVVRVTASITDTTKLEVGTHTITYTTSDRAGHTTTATRTIIVLDPVGDNDNDGYTNEEEIENGTNPDDGEEYPEYSKNPSIDFSSCATSMTVYDELINFEECVKVTDEFYGTEGVTSEIISDINPNQFGNYTVTIVAKDILGNETTETFEFEVLKRDVTVTIDNIDAIYKEEVKTLTSNASEMAYNGNDIGVVLSTEVTNTTPTGKYPITGTWTNENYNVTFVDGVYSISSKTLTEEDIKELGIEFKNDSFIYDGTEKYLSVNNLPKTFNVIYNNNGQVNADVYEVEAIITGDENYNGTITLKAFMIINPKEARVYWIYRGAFTYNGLRQLPTATAEDGVEISIDVKEGNAIDVGTYTAVASTTNKNYTLTNETLEYEIVAKTLTEEDINELGITFENSSFVYDGTAKSIKVNNLPEGFNVTYTNNEQINVGTYEVVATVTGNENYTGTVELKATMTITAKEVSVVWKGSTFTYNGTKQLPTATAEGVEITIDVKEGNSIDVGSYTTVASTTDKNYKLANTEYNYEIVAKTLTEEDITKFGITFENGSFVYDGTTKSIKVNNLPEGFNVTYTNNEQVNVGSYEVVATVTGNENYTGTVELKATMTITAKEVSVVWEGSTFTYNGLRQLPTATAEDGVEITINVKEGNAIDVGTYTAVASTTNKNYKLTNETLEYEILKAQPSYTIPTDLEAEEGQTLGDIELPKGFTFEEDLETVLTEGKYTTTVTYTPEDTKNYDVVEGIEVTIKVNPVYFTIKFVDKDNAVISSQTIKKGGNATEPNITKEYEANGKIYVFNGWEGKYTNVTANATIKPIYLEQNASGTYAYILESKYIRPENGEGYPTNYYYNALEDEDGNKVSLTINVSGLTEQQANDIRNGVDPVIVGLGEEEVFKYLAQSTKDALAEITHGVDEGGAYTIEWYVLKYQADGWHLDGHKVYDKTVVTVNKNYGYITIDFNNAVTNLTVEVNGKEKDVKNGSWNDKVGNEWYVWATNAKTVKVTYTVNGIEYTETFNV